MGLMQGTVFAFNLPARQAMLPELVERDDLMNAIALSNTARNVSAIVAPAIAGALMAIVDVAIVFYVQGLLNLVVVALITRLPAGTSHLANDVAVCSPRSGWGCPSSAVRASCGC
jgi:sugar phosphate permease